ncbi:Spy/CpxP family protein refolding chaperone [Prosthecobacter sp.]|uniref:Spy/CpxP family protein refolding chaperone n=1 Tax=Prosthecobacter sp. TaxID=1965333 RepID=UPI00378325A1
MKHIVLTILLLSVCAIFAADNAAPKNDPFGGAFFPPEVIMQLHSQLGLSPQQLETFQARAMKTQPQSEELRKKLEAESAALAALAKKDHVEEAAIIAQLDKVLDAERELKHLHIGLMVAAKNLLTAEQQTKLREMTKDGGARIAEAARARLTEKIERVKAGAQAWAAGGRDPSEVLRAMEQTFKPLIESGKIMEAEAELDRVLEQLKPDAK